MESTLTSMNYFKTPNIMLTVPSQTEQHLSSGWMVLEQVSSGQITGSQITVRFYRWKKNVLWNQSKYANVRLELQQNVLHKNIAMCSKMWVLSLPGSCMWNTCHSWESSGNHERDTGSQRSRCLGLSSAPLGHSGKGHQTQPPLPLLGHQVYSCLVHGPGNASSNGVRWRGMAFEQKRKVKVCVKCVEN